jgi:hypothetical protein
VRFSFHQLLSVVKVHDSCLCPGRDTQLSGLSDEQLYVPHESEHGIVNNSSVLKPFCNRYSLTLSLSLPLPNVAVRMT